MNKEHETGIIMALTPYLLAFPQSRMTTEGLVIYAKALSSLSIAEINAAMLKLMRTARFFPTVAEIFEQAAAMREFADGSGLPSPDEAWAEVQREVRRKHLYGAWEFSCPEIGQAAENFGREALCSLNVDEVNTARAQFMRIYAAVASRAKDRKTNEEILALLPREQYRALAGSLPPCRGERNLMPRGGAQGKESGAPKSRMHCPAGGDIS